MTQEVERAQPAQSKALAFANEVRSKEFVSQIEALLPENVPARRFVRATVSALLADPSIVECRQDSIFAAILRSAMDGLTPDGREAVIVPFKEKGGGKQAGGKQATYLPMIGGLRKIAAEHGWSLRTRVVYSREPFDFVAGAKPDVYHKPSTDPATRGELSLAYAVARSRDGRVELDVMTKAEIEKVRKSSRSPNAGPWVDWTEGMWEKTVARRLFKQLPLDPKDRERIERVLRADDLEPGQAEELVYGRSELSAGREPARQQAPAVVVADATADEAPAAPPEPEDGASQPDPGSEPLFEGEEPEPEADSELLDFALPKEKFPKRGGTTIRALVEAGDRRYLRFLATEVNDDEIRAAGKAGLEALEGSS